ncbi:gas vesicle protein [Cylindrospermopsis raciborskii]|uniref:Gas vesicle protein GvpA n=1 Tax=Cylindrospermopsis raciborskii CENA302 TaxID=1170768 RepID=A0A9Q5QUI9_9CYAN|nr:gas vesicle protein [Cylindrospermopsis raciborskii]NLQ05006.1 gas vesicle protein [Cylindrospermopsis raciborskii MVCC19]MCZ2202769.1 gas vesicle protein [Cylindrospermopsis raciborskii PAMP2012]MCZ2207411.1 gas vesicle protein [Cylindrospermopsis raciborskii PAMP2011]OHY32184.1 gas vesicle protein GvpA [Cylindrospermopsis raciborskii MVCC14]OPH08571.1 gas vesicle protein GvpA [Cylindrospermopsis raciborskii CENA302]
MNSPILPTRSQVSSGQVIKTSTQGSTLADILERVLDKGIVIAGDISVSIASTELLHIRIRLLIASVDKAKEMGINWWEGDPYLSSKAQGLIEENRELRGRLANLESQINLLTSDIAKTSVEKPELTVENNLNGDDNTQELSEEITPISVGEDELEQYTIVSERIPGNLQENTDYIGDFNQQDFVLEETETTQPDTQAVVELDDEIG